MTLVEGFEQSRVLSRLRRGSMLAPRFVRRPLRPDIEGSVGCPSKTANRSLLGWRVARRSMPSLLPGMFDVDDLAR